MFRGEIRLVDLEPAVGNEANKRRPSIIVSNEAANQRATKTGRGVITIVPLTSNVSTVRSFQTFLPGWRTGLRADSKAQAEQVRALAVEKVGPALGEVPADLMHKVDDALRLHLDLWQ